MLGFHSVSAAPISARRDLSTTQPSDPFNLTDGLDDSLETLDLDTGQLSFYQQIDDDVAAVLDLTLVYILDVIFDEAEDPVSFYQTNEDEFDLSPTGFDLDDSTNQDSSDFPDLSFYQQLDDDVVVVQPDALFGSFDYADDTGLFDDDASSYQQIDDDVVVVQPDALFGNFDFIDDAGLFDDATSFYYQADDDAAVVTPPAAPTAGGVAKHYILSGERKNEAEREPEPEPKRNRQPFKVTLDKKPLDLKVLSDRLFDLGKQLGKNRQAVKDRIKAEQAAAKVERDEKIVVILQLIQLFELELYNQNARRLLLILAEDRA